MPNSSEGGKYRNDLLSLYKLSQEKIKMPSANCPVCEGRVYVDPNTEQGEIISCEDCDSNLELVGMDPIELDPAFDDDSPFVAFENFDGDDADEDDLRA